MDTDIEFEIPNTQEFHAALGVVLSLCLPNSKVPQHLAVEIGMVFDPVLKAWKADGRKLIEDNEDLKGDMFDAYCEGVKNTPFSKVERYYCERHSTDQIPEEVREVLKEAHKKGFYYLVGRVSRLMSMHQPWYIEALAK